ncbi:hypothetical protein BKH41_08685 [Helicobacter sp. 12S02232-10]|uniref:type VI secretion system domain-containing protein n=1 Tax=Helicobacter sp. 12S02232-10 TaxID=1476197 RepID=UPI000BA546D4|nr:type VI secretion system domain-containing protein [Helicobacter sp. 12S02232-10]PAF46722.1 hypothetical protein BKH41_08685 [Helicobacter sp. 12S02232-10]
MTHHSESLVIVIDTKLENLNNYNSIQEEMSKYKTLAHESIDWNSVYAYSLEILSHSTLDTRILQYLILACISLNEVSKTNTLANVLNHYAIVWEKSISNLSEKEKSTQKKFFYNALETLVSAINEGRLYILEEAFETIEKALGIIMQYSKNFPELTKSIPNPPQETSSVQIETPQVLKTPKKINDLNALNDREYREYFVSLAQKFLEDDPERTIPFVLYAEATWGRLITMPEHKNQITSIPYPQENITKIFYEAHKFDLNTLMSLEDNLVINPFWFEGQRIFLEFLKKNYFFDIAASVTGIILRLQKSRPNLLELKFNNGKNFLTPEDYSYFKDLFHHTIDQKLVPKSDKKEFVKQDLESKLKDIDMNIAPHSIRSKVNSLLKIADTLWEDKMFNSAKIIYAEIVKILENTSLKDWLEETYTRIKKASDGE